MRNSPAGISTNFKPIALVIVFGSASGRGASGRGACGPATSGPGAGEPDAGGPGAGEQALTLTSMPAASPTAINLVHAPRIGHLPRLLLAHPRSRTTRPVLPRTVPPVATASPS
jgi:hypothetical protein